MSNSGKILKKIEPYKYPGKIHTRTETPPQYASHRRYKPFLQREFNRQCVYCRKPDSDQNSANFHVEHFRPVKYFPELSNIYENLFYSCSTCNGHKSDHWSDEQCERILNPCDNVMTQHLYWESEEVLSRTKQGALTIEALRLNNSESVTVRSRQRRTLLLLIRGIIRLKDSSATTDQVWTNNALQSLSELTGKSVGDLKTLFAIK